MTRDGRPTAPRVRSAAASEIWRVVAARGRPALRGVAAAGCSGVLPATRRRAAARGLTPNDVCALVGCGGLFGLAGVSQLIGQVAERVPGRLVAFFPGELDARTNAYRLLGAKDGWGYLAVPITV